MSQATLTKLKSKEDPKNPIAYVKAPVTTSDKVAEYLKCQADPLYFIENYIELEETGGNIKMKLYEPQKGFLRSFADRSIN